MIKRPWLENRDWEFVVAVNAALCEAGKALHRPTSDGYEEARTFWAQNYGRQISLGEAVEICRRCHQLAPFCNFNGNTFVAIIRDAIACATGLSHEEIALAQSLAGHIVAGTAEPEESIQFGRLLKAIEERSAKG